MATSAFKSTTKRTQMGKSSNVDDSGSSNKAHRRSRSLSRFSRTPTDPSEDFGDVPARRGRFVNTNRGSGFPEISLDDLAVEFFPFKDPVSVDDREGDGGRGSRRASAISPSTDATVSSHRRGRSVSRQSTRIADGKGVFPDGSGGGRPVSDPNSRRRRSVSVVRCQISDSESDLDHSQYHAHQASKKIYNSENRRMPSFQKPTSSSHRRLGRSLSQIDLSKSLDSYSTLQSQTSALTDDETKDACSSKNMIEKTIRAVYAQKKAEHPIGDDVNGGLYEAMRKELRYVVDEIRMELKQAMVRKTSASESGDCLESDNSDVIETVSAIRKHYATKLEQSEKRKKDLLDEIVLEEQRGKELSKIVRELLPGPKSSTVTAKPSQARKRSNDRNKVSQRLTEEAEKYFEDFISNVEDTDISSFDGERSDASSTLGGTIKPRDVVAHYVEIESFQSPAASKSLSVEMDGVILPWLQWDTSNDVSALPLENKKQSPVTPRNLLRDPAQEGISMHDPSSQSTSSHGSWSPALAAAPSSNSKQHSGSLLKDHGSYQRSQFDMERYLKLKQGEDLLFETWRERDRINSGGLLLCGHVLF